MPGRGTPRHTIRIPDPIWDRFGEAAGDRAAILRQLVLWYLGEGELPARPVDVEREPAGAKLPDRPPRGGDQ